MQIITSVKNPQAAAWRRLKSRLDREEAGLFLVEGAKMAAEAARMPGRIQALLVDLDRQEQYARLMESAPCPVTLVSAHVLAAVCDTKTPQGVAAVVALAKPPDLSGLGRRVVAMDGVQDPGNVGTILRTADAAGFTGALLSCACADPYSQKALRATMGSIFRLPVLTVSDLPGALARLREGGKAILSSQLDGRPFFEREDIGDSYCLVIGSEGSGVSPKVQAQATHRFRLPMRGGAESLNAAVAAGIMMYSLTRDLPETIND